MRKIDKFIDEIQALKSKGYDTKKIDALTEGVNLIAAEYRRRKTKEEAQKKAMVEAAGFAKLDEQRKASGLSMKAFLEGVGNTIIACGQPDEVKERMMDTLGKYASLTEAADTIATRWAEGHLDDTDRQLLANGDIEGFKKRVMERTQMAYRWEAQAKFDEIANLATTKNGKFKEYTVSRILIDSPDEKLLLLKPAGTAPANAPGFLYAAKVTQSHALESVDNIQTPAAGSVLTPEEHAAFNTVQAVLMNKETELASLFNDADWAESHITMAIEFIDELFSVLPE